MRVLSLWQPFASLCVYGLKSVETRNRPTLIRGRIGILATATEPKEYRFIGFHGSLLHGCRGESHMS